MYINIVDDLLRHPDDKPSIGLLLVKEKNQVVVEYSLEGYIKPMGVAEWARQIDKSLPEDLKSSLPTIEEIEAELDSKTERKPLCDSLYESSKPLVPRFCVWEHYCPK